MITNLEYIIDKLYNSKLDIAKIYLEELDSDEYLTLHEGDDSISISIKDFKDIFEEDFTNRSKFLYTVKEGSNKFALIDNNGVIHITFKTFESYIKYVLKHKNHITLDDFYLSLYSEVTIIAEDVIKYLAFKVENIDVKETAINNLEILIKMVSEFKYGSEVKTKIIYDQSKLLLKIVEDPSNIVSHITKDNENIIVRILINNKWWATRNEFITNDCRIVMPREDDFTCDILTARECIENSYCGISDPITDSSLMKYLLNIDYVIKNFII